MKSIIIDVDGVLISKDGAKPDFIEEIIDYCLLSRIRLYFTSKTSKEFASKIIHEQYAQLVNKPIQFVDYEQKLDFIPSLVISTRQDLITKYGGVLLPYFDRSIHSRFACLAIMGRLIETIKDRVVLNKIEQKPTTTKEEKEKPKDTSFYGFIVR